MNKIKNFDIVVNTCMTDIESRLKSGSRKRYDEQLCHFNQLQSNNSELQRLINLIHNERKAYDQEGYICNSILFT